MAGRFLIALIALLLSGNFATARSINDIPVAREALLRIVSPKFYRSLLISPVEGWIVVRGDLTNDSFTGSEGGSFGIGRPVRQTGLGARPEFANRGLHPGRYVERAPGRPGSSVGLSNRRRPDGDVIAHLDESGGNQLRYSGAAWMAVLKGDKWVTIEPHQLTPRERRGRACIHWRWSCQRVRALCRATGGHRSRRCPSRARA